MEENILISYLNDFIFCPVSIYFHKLYGTVDKNIYHTTDQTEGLNAHKAIDAHSYSTKKNILQGMNVYCEKYGLQGKIDVFDVDEGLLTERKRKISTLYEGYIFQVYAQYYALTEMGYRVSKIRFYSMADNKIYPVKLPLEDLTMNEKFENLIQKMRNFKMENFEQSNQEKCRKCIYEPSCDRSLLC